MNKITLYRVVVKKRQQRNKIYTFHIGNTLMDRNEAIAVASGMAKSITSSIERKFKIKVAPAASISSADYYEYKAEIYADSEWVASVTAYPINIQDNYYEYRTMSIHNFANKFIISIAMTDIAVLDSINEALMFVDWFMLQ